MKRKILFFSCIVLLMYFLLLTFSSAEIFLMVKQDVPEVYVLKVLTPEGIFKGNCFPVGCFEIKEGYKYKFFTAAHMFKGRKVERITLIGKDFWVNGKLKNLVFRKGDVASFTFIGSNKIKVFKIQKNMKIGDIVYIYSMILRESKYFSSGRICSEICKGFYLTNIQGRSGMSGSPILNNGGEVVGIVSQIEYQGVAIHNAQWRPVIFSKIF